MSPNPLAHDDIKLMESIRRGDADAFHRLFRRYYVDIVIFCHLFLARMEDCEDVVQGVFLRLWESRDNLPHMTNVKAYLLRSAQNTCLNELHHRDVAMKYSSAYLTMLPFDLSDDADMPLLYSDLTKLINAAEATLGKNEFEVWNLRYHHEKKHAEIAIELGISVRTVEERISRAKKYFRKFLKRYWILIITIFSTY